MTGLPDPIRVDWDNIPEGELPELPDGFTWQVEIKAEAEVIHPDGSKE